MKIIRSGVSKQEWSKTLTCVGFSHIGNGCGAILVVELSDLYRVSVYFGGNPDYVSAFMCPECGAETLVNDYTADECFIARLPLKTE